ncbi:MULTISPECIES: ECF transporter S component [unclassified Enterococcus]|uniref:ECF transporter S component n=1 Tax=unclassified Enterococcus TaxID=2608891 RepID=UPI001CE10299|nr:MULTISPECIES: ECF transporter S component [unclassified Enterococcus]MCA5013496.1 ECF transporter S component [Enterococcus sp. S23]MCA5016746.1 ECF transporter S component [Enterococcus sp. S22(2020)]
MSIKDKQNGIKLLFGLVFLLVCIAAFLSAQYQIISLLLVLLACLPIYYRYEKKQMNIKELVLIAVLTAFAVSGRFLFYMIPAVTPMTAIIIISGICIGPEVGFLVGSLSAIISNMLFGQGPWTPFQMLSWGLIGCIAGLPWMSSLLKKSYWFLAVYGIFAGLFFSFFMDIWTVYSIDRFFSWQRYAALFITALPHTLSYCFSNVFFSCVLFRVIQKKLQRILIKYEIK